MAFKMVANLSTLISFESCRSNSRSLPTVLLPSEAAFAQYGGSTSGWVIWLRHMLMGGRKVTQICKLPRKAQHQKSYMDCSYR